MIAIVPVSLVHFLWRLIGFVESSANLDQKQKVAITGGNAAQLLKIGTGVSHE